MKSFSFLQKYEQKMIAHNGDNEYYNIKRLNMKETIFML
jgi:hypothetical protein